jgi:hypothetical protein
MLSLVPRRPRPFAKSRFFEPETAGTAFAEKKNAEAGTSTSDEAERRKTDMATATRTSTRTAPPKGAPTVVQVLSNPLATQDPALARAVESTLQELLAAEALGALEVRFKVCPDTEEGVRFICKVENPPAHDMDSEARTQWRWWSPLMETLQDFRVALQEAVQVRRQRLGTPVSAHF